MYIPPFVCGIVATIAVEILALIIYGIYESNKEDKKNEADESTDERTEGVRGRSLSEHQGVEDT